MSTPSTSAPAATPEASDPVVDRILDAALELFEDIGIRKTTIEDVARRAGVDRVTVYRRIGSRDQLGQAVVAREARRVFERSADVIGVAQSLEDQVVAFFTGLARNLRNHPLLERLVSIEPDTTLPKVTTEASGLLAMAVHWAVATLHQHGDERVRAITDLPARLEIVARLMHSMVLTKHAVVDLDTEEQLTDFARAYVVPIVTGPSAAS
ncbi:MAG TPA: helix-turn-helix domain-containing protein [Pseudonocardia sp.]|nr:helix-turn-helix domain-containing protein [Pseudonocardia sp.]